MATSEVNYIYDADSAFRGPGEAAVVASGEIGTLALDKLVNVRDSDQRNTLGAESYALVIAVSALDLADTDETYVFDVEVQAAGGGNAVTAVTFPVVAAGKSVITLDADTLEKLSADREELALNLTVGGTTPSITFAAWIAPAR